MLGATLYARVYRDKLGIDKTGSLALPLSDTATLRYDNSSDTHF